MSDDTDVPPHLSAQRADPPAPVDAPKPNTAMLKGDIDSGRSGDKVEVFDPGMAMLGTCEEAGGNALSPKDIARAASPRSRNGGACLPANRATPTTISTRRWPCMSASSGLRGWASPRRSGSCAPPRDRREPAGVRPAGTPTRRPDRRRRQGEQGADRQDEGDGEESAEDADETHGAASLERCRAAFSAAGSDGRTRRKQGRSEDSRHAQARIARVATLGLATAGPRGDRGTIRRTPAGGLGPRRALRHRGLGNPLLSWKRAAGTPVSGGGDRHPQVTGRYGVRRVLPDAVSPARAVKP